MFYLIRSYRYIHPLSHISRKYRLPTLYFKMHPNITKMTFTSLQIPTGPSSVPSSSTPTSPTSTSSVGLSPEEEAHVISELLDPEAKVGLARREALLEMLSGDMRGAIQAQIRRESPVGLQGNLPLSRQVRGVVPQESGRKWRLGRYMSRLWITLWIFSIWLRGLVSN